MLTDAGFQKYLVQHDFKDEKQKYLHANIAFWTNLFISCIILVIIIFFRNTIAKLVGNPELGNVIAIASIQLLFTSFSSIQMALYRRDFNFKILFVVRIFAIFVPFFINIPLALLGFGYWSIIIGTLLIQIFSAIFLTIKSKWKPSFKYDFNILREMLSFSLWSLLEETSIWATSWIDVFILGSVLNDYYLGIYRTSQAMVNSIFGVITSAIVPVLFSTLSRMKDSEEAFKKTYYEVQRIVATFVFPMGIGMFIFRNFTTNIILGDQWRDASLLIGMWALTSSWMIVFGYFCSEVYRAKGKPKLSFLAQILHLVFLIPIILVFEKKGFSDLVIARSLVRLEFILVHLILMKFIFHFSVKKTFTNVSYSLLASAIIGIIGFFLAKITNNIIINFAFIIFLSLLYFFILYLNPNSKQDLKNYYYKIKKNI